MIRLKKSIPCIGLKRGFSTSGVGFTSTMTLCCPKMWSLGNVWPNEKVLGSGMELLLSAHVSGRLTVALGRLMDCGAKDWLNKVAGSVVDCGKANASEKLGIGFCTISEIGVMLSVLLVSVGVL